MRYPHRLVGAVLCPAAFSCTIGGDPNSQGAGGTGKPDADMAIDASTAADAQTSCATATSYPAPPAGTSTNYAAAGSGSSATPHELVYTTRLDNASPTDVLFVDLYAGYGVFSGTDIHTGTFTITGNDTKYSTCGACVLIAANVTSSAIGDWYMATSGTLTLTSVNIGQIEGDGSAHFRGTLSNVTFKHVTKDSKGGPSDTAVGDCNSALPSATLDAKMAVGSAASAEPSARTLEPADVVLHNRWK